MARTREEEQSDSPGMSYALPAAGLAGAGGYLYSRRFNPSDDPALRALQEQAKDRDLVVLTTPPKDRVRELMIGARNEQALDFSKRPKTEQDVVGLYHTPEHRRLGTTSVAVNAGQLPDLLDDKHTFSQLVAQGTGGGGRPDAVPRTMLLDDLLREHRGDYEKARAAFGGDFVIKPRSGSMSDPTKLLTNQTDPREQRLREALKYPKQFVIQQKIPIEKEFRVHTVNHVPVAATHRRLEGESAGIFKQLANKLTPGATAGGAFVPVNEKEMERRLFDFVRENTKHIGVGPGGKSIVGTKEHLHHGLDVAMLPDGSFKLIESNPVPGSYMNPHVNQRVNRAITGRDPRMLAALKGVGAAAGAAGLTYAAERGLAAWRERQRAAGEQDARSSIGA